MEFSKILSLSLKDKLTSQLVTRLSLALVLAEISLQRATKSSDLTDEYTGTDIDKTKVPTIAALDALYTLLTTAIGDKVDKVTGKDLSTNDYTDNDKEIVTSLSNNISTCFCIIISAVLLALMSVDLLIPVI